MTHHAFVDESKVGGFTFYAAVVSAEQVGAARTATRATRARGSARLHFRRDSDRVRKAALGVVRRLPVDVYEFDFRGFSPSAARALALQSLVETFAGMSVDRLVFELDESVLQHDRRVLAETTKAVGATFSYAHLRAADEPMLWVPDAVGWCDRRGKPWSGQVAHMIKRVRHEAA